MTDEQPWIKLGILAGKVFTPHTPVNERDVFAGRIGQVRQVVDAVSHTGQHAIIFGERGVGKTSLANVLKQFFSDPDDPVIIAPRITCDSTDTFSSVWIKILEDIELTYSQPITGFSQDSLDSTHTATVLVDGKATPDSVRRVLTKMSRGSLPILIFDEFDRLPHHQRGAFADTIKSLSDSAVAATVVLVGVGETVDELIEEHHSVQRALVQVHMPRMTFEEIATIFKKGFERLGVEITPDTMARMARLALGMPHYGHLLGLHAARAAIDEHTLVISDRVVRQAITRAIETAQHSIRSAHSKAIASARKDSLFGDVLLACALAEKNDMGLFAAQDVRQPMRQITGKPYDIPHFVQHLTDFSDAKRGRILARLGEPRRYRYRFTDPLMQPFVVMKGIEHGKISEQFTSPSDASVHSLPLWQYADAPPE